MNQSRKYAMLVGDGMADFPLPALENKTPLEYARTPGMDTIASRGYIGRVKTVPEGMPPGSDVANMSLFGYDPARYYQGRAPIEAASMGVVLEQSDVAFRCNLVTIKEGIMHDYAGGHFTPDEAAGLIESLQNVLNSTDCTFYPGMDYRHLMVLSGFDGSEFLTVPPHDITGKPVLEYLPKGGGSQRLIDLMHHARTLLEHSPVNKERIGRGKPAATDIWLWGQGRAIVLPSLAQRYALTGSVVSAVNLVKGLGLLAGLSVPPIAGATGYLGTNYAGKVSAACNALKEQDFVFVHVEAPDETSHEGDLEKKIIAIEEFDRHIVGEFLKLQQDMPQLRLLVTPDHATPLSLKTHHADPVPFTVCGEGIAAQGRDTYSEKSAQDAKLYSGVTLFDLFITGSFPSPF